MINKGYKLVCLVLVFSAFASCKKSKDPVVEPKPEPPVLSADKVLKTFAFKASKNPVLVNDVNGEIIGDTIYARAFAGTDISKLAPVFTYEGKKVTVGDIAQRSDTTINDFTKLVTYNIIAEDGTKKSYIVKFTDNGVSALYINTNNVPITSKEVYVTGSIKIVSNFKDVVYDGKTEIKGRGNSTWYDMPKKPYRIKLDKKAALLGMPESKNWVLLANYADKTLMRNELAFILSRNIGRAFTPASRYVEVYLNGAYLGNYQLTEQIKEGKGLVDIEEQPKGTTTLPDLAGGYLIEQDLFANGEPIHFYTAKNMPFVIKYPDEDDINQEQKDYIKNHFQKFEDALYAADYTDPVNGYRKYFDVNTYVDHYLINEVIGNPDAFRSTYLFKKRNDEKIYTGPIWDFDKAANNDNRLGDQVHGLMANSAFEPKIWLKRLLTDQSFRQRIRARWNEIKPKIYALTSSMYPIAAKLAVSQVRNFTKWDILNKQSYLELQVNGSYAGEIQYLKTFLNDHIAWLDGKFNSAEYQ
ncbi:CotH kinase family protein [Pedobacter ginsengisoli]|uniref:CotH kinase family protein n=1 Tax=Pedobacter ginsengisoli TaxID=363852 RepID=UPI00254BADD1|nr:CotH kinase family protein [Pedobacter ginsengisoli]